MLFASLRVSWSDAPFGYLSRDTDLETVGAGGYAAAGRVVSVDDAQMGWSRYAQSSTPTWPTSARLLPDCYLIAT